MTLISKYIWTTQADAERNIIVKMYFVLVSSPAKEEEDRKTDSSKYDVLFLDGKREKTRMLENVKGLESMVTCSARISSLFSDRRLWYINLYKSVQAMPQMKRIRDLKVGKAKLLRGSQHLR